MRVIMKTLEMLLVTNQQIDFSQFNNWKITLVDNIETAIANYEPRIDLLNITLSGDPDSHTLTASIVFRGKNSTEISEATISLDRIR